jgi:hypothetical protein
MKQELCEAFCQELEVVPVQAGLAVGTGFEKGDGDRIGFYIIGPTDDGLYRIQDDGSTVPYLEAAGADLDLSTREKAFHSLLEEYNVEYDYDSCELTTSLLSVDEVPKAAMKFVAVLLRLQDMLLLTRERAESTWIEEATRDLEQAIASRASIEPNSAVAPQLSAYPADLVIRSSHRDPVALFFGSSDLKVYEALLLHACAKYQMNIPCAVVVLLEKDSSISRKNRIRADNTVVVPRYRDGEKESIGRIVEEAIGQRPMFHS